MKKVLFGLGAVALLATASCKSDSNNNNGNNTTPANTWKVGSTSYTATTVSGGNPSGYYIMTATASSGSSANTISFYFTSTATPTAGTYKVVNSVGGTGQQVFVSAGGYNGTTLTSYSTTGNDNTYATVAINSGKVVVTLPDTWALGTGTDSVKISANAITQP